MSQNDKQVKRGKRAISGKMKINKKEAESSYSESDDEKLLYDYFRLDVSLENMYLQWSQNDPKFQDIATKFQGVRMLKQDPTENIFSFICSSNNNIARYSIC